MWVKILNFGKEKSRFESRFVHLLAAYSWAFFFPLFAHVL